MQTGLHNSLGLHVSSHSGTYCLWSLAGDIELFLKNNYLIVKVFTKICFQYFVVYLQLNFNGIKKG